ncbi:hypothetical protein IQE94_15165 [Synechocystis sp. PCC 7339]|uniref:hypothetical protein n=1 Tax=unclassified Synechocystis TaxID=2640012 RepID=UPI001BAFD583|nr:MULTISPECIES: hypothetical protein [unclassified Synechocystis]QUS60160.1 hypothetical protein HTZ78_05395 [Synechocystis sp. PCC 7338]UAJ72394.1 hypothetical protein IQE94_15165 [Synechocystis sp. PCC 7339]
MNLLILGSLSIAILSAAVVSQVKAENLSHQTLFLPISNQPVLIAQASVSLTVNANDGTPQGINKDQWLKAKAQVSSTASSGGNYRVTVNASGLVPNGLYTLWWVNKKPIGMDVGPAGAVPSNEFKADANGNGSVTITVPTNNNYQMLAVAFHADKKTHGQMPGKTGEVTFTQLMGNFPKAK